MSKANKLKPTMQQRELSLLSFNRCVLEEAKDAKNALPNRMKFAGIVSSNLDEFYRVRFGALTNALEKVTKKKKKKSLVKLLEAIQEDTAELHTNIEQTVTQIFEELDSAGVSIRNEDSLTKEQADWCRDFFDRAIWPYTSIYTEFDSDILSKAINSERIYLLAVPQKSSRYALLGVMAERLPRLVLLPASQQKGRTAEYIWLDDILRLCFPSILIANGIRDPDFYCVKCSRNAEMSNDLDLRGDLVGKWERRIKERSEGVIVRMTYDRTMPSRAVKFLAKRLNVDKSATHIPGGRYHNMRDLIQFADQLELPASYKKSKDQRKSITIPEITESKTHAQAFVKGDRLLFVPYHSFRHLLHILQQAAISPKVRGIKITLYRVAKDSGIIRALINALRNGKEVSVLLELGARFDERANLEWLQRLDNAGAEIIVGPNNYKVHAKVCLIEGVEQKDSLAVISTGNFNEQHATRYSDIIYVSKDKTVISDVDTFFSFLQDSTPIVRYEKLVVAPRMLRLFLTRKIRREIRNATDGLPAFIHLKLNNLTDPSLVKLLEEAAEAGVQLKLNVRSSMSFNPDNPLFAENKPYAVRIVDQYLEHARILVFGNAGDPEVYLTSADWMKRNMDHRVEIAVPITDEKLKGQLLSTLEFYFSDNTKARVLDQAQSNIIVDNGGKAVCAQSDIYTWLADNNGQEHQKK